MKTTLIVDFDTRRLLFQKIIVSLGRLPSREDWDLNWGEPFLAVSHNRQIWIRVFYEESLPVSPEKLKHEIERLQPHIPGGGELCLCVPQAWGLSAEDLPEDVVLLVRFWSYAHSEKNLVHSHETVRGQSFQLPSPGGFAVVSRLANPELDRRLSTDEVRELAEMGLALKRLSRNKVS